MKLKCPRRGARSLLRSSKEEARVAGAERGARDQARGRGPLAEPRAGAPEAQIPRPARSDVLVVSAANQEPEKQTDTEGDRESGPRVVADVTARFGPDIAVVFLQLAGGGLRALANVVA